MRKTGTRSSNILRSSLFLLGLAVVALFSSCGSTSDPEKKPPPRTYGPYGPRTIQDSVAPPPHNLPRHEYPFDSQGNYISSWAR